MKPQTLFTMIVAVAWSALAAGCCGDPVVYEQGHYGKVKRCGELRDADIICTNRNAVDNMLWTMHQKPARRDRILVATLVDLNDLKRSSMFGRIMSETLATQLTRKGYSVVNIKLRENSMIVNSQGEFLLSREVQNLAAAHDAKAALVGTYARSGDSIFVNIRLVRTGDNIVLASYDYTLPQGPETRAMFGENSLGIYAASTGR